MIEIKSDGEIRIMRAGGKILAQILAELIQKSKPNVNLLEIEDLANLLCRKWQVEPSFKKVPGYKYTTCLCVNEAVVHGIPKNYRLKNGDILGIDVGIFYRGFHLDAAQSILIGKGSKTDFEDKRRFLEIGKRALKEAIMAAKVGNYVGNISYAIQKNIEGAGYSVVRSLTGHGVGRKLHEDPSIPGFLRGEIEKTLPLQSGMTLAIEVIYNQGKSAVEYANNDGWTIKTKDNSPAGLFEDTVVISSKGPIVLTKM